MHSIIGRTELTDSAHGTHARIDLAAISANTSVLVSAAAGTPVMAVVKSNAYGHGLVPAARAALDGGASRLGMAQVEDALTLRQAGVEAPILAWLPWRQADYDAAVLADVELGVEAPWRLALMAEAAERNGRPVRVHLEVDTGLSRGGATRDDWPQLVEAARRAQAAGHVTVTGVFSHFACADDPGHPSVAAQIDAFDDAVRYAVTSGVEPELRHLASSAALLTVPESHYDLVRAGLALYGLSPLESGGDFGLRPAMSLRSTVAVAKRIPAGTGVMYGLTYRVPSDSTIVVVPVGYADGLPRAAGTAGVELLVAGRRHRIAGVVGMEQTVLDVGQDLPSPGEEVVLFGPGDEGELTLTELARQLDLLPAEILARIPAALPRIYES
ncbi:alanine racemase [Actinoallomurus iriomotensis]|uniref:Alanine racemase n=1 Tax=Actinoallomurus iriomotensis TaxID=478107 RepID=A0A9W6VQ58_9ACTN|nr:alanine racemase [Actinoallomurus iriomotensis]GLY75127.1 alanine racemase [Actinoallomurus iriomotensis]